MAEPTITISTGSSTHTHTIDAEGRTFCSHVVPWHHYDDEGNHYCPTGFGWCGVWLESLDGEGDGVIGGDFDDIEPDVMHTHPWQEHCKIWGAPGER